MYKFLINNDYAMPCKNLNTGNDCSLTNTVRNVLRNRNEQHYLGLLRFCLKYTDWYHNNNICSLIMCTLMYGSYLF